MDKILINAITIKEGGGAVVFIKTLNEMLQLEKNCDWIIIIDEALLSQINRNDKVIMLTFPWIKKSPLHFLYWNEFVLPKLIKKMDVDCVFSQVNTLPFRGLSCFTFLSILHAGYFSEEFEMLNSKYNPSFRSKIGWWIRKKWVYLSIKKATKVVTPTEALKNEIRTRLKLNENKIISIYPGAGLAEGNAVRKTYYPKNIWRIGYITKYGVQKNFDVLFKAVAELKLQTINFKLVLTLDEKHAPFQLVNSLIKQYGIADLIENHGELDAAQLKNLYSTLDLFVFPSLCESIGFTLLEAMHYGIPVISANISSSRELLGNSGVFFQSLDHVDLVREIIAVLRNKTLYENLSAYNIDRCRLYSWEKSAQNTLTILKELTCVSS
ncbi:MAG: Glycosyltransferase [uncultured bacterium]|nr:MAG: Glycosyltransferase [uncultured bacterium]OGT25412.1 MAG: hypothetical protein A3B71_05015 [Gammaproteobacteria bacterium RIFCSPHIGHO2_02_FULL_42_43]OGT28914.1 MAG: hypothetical protein A2624_02340 [Gammaproteobacteria bacterium RIFCSPHIGHO2_01_FULL_42_8]OGT51364.1 MAG: hypothetical protein A3E54_04780 [Gammaproteobacteria bacterium RIFCSPHIGHO2_12_FULL_41_25]OGT62066.1 MAG: hypothetical protein A3I77_03710 [Gammaproteobacteria bacterium RIFCSPLOWO2_02_FULL_42_14]OGT85738.1 MAG: hypoth